jgi:hypothetical protein
MSAVATTPPPPAKWQVEAYQQTPKTSIPMPPNAFYKPTEWEYYSNQNYWNAWICGSRKFGSG